ncbi:MAG: winged helix-turn-helix domain-containing protein [Thermoproteota archaeon]|nr:winged helix-turn-helix domain-containing protein [Thermoproteota archaeon]NLF88764.1 winged helix-turn-helix transcriptional regulator [Candidatus Bathyarchaeota archaeon]
MSSGVRDLPEDESSDVLKGTALDIYRLLLRSRKSLGIREIQRALKLSSPSVAQYHISKLEHAGLLKKEAGNYTVDKLILENCVKISRFLIPRYLFYLSFAITILLIELTVLRPLVFNGEYFFYVSVTALSVLVFLYETIKVWRKGSL